MLAFDEMHKKNTRASIKYRQKITKKTENNVVNASERREYVYACSLLLPSVVFFSKEFFLAVLAWIYVLCGTSMSVLQNGKYS